MTRIGSALAGRWTARSAPKWCSYACSRTTRMSAPASWCRASTARRPSSYARWPSTGRLACALPSPACIVETCSHVRKWRTTPPSASHGPCSATLAGRACMPGSWRSTRQASARSSWTHVNPAGRGYVAGTCATTWRPCAPKKWSPAQFPSAPTGCAAVSSRATCSRTPCLISWPWLERCPELKRGSLRWSPKSRIFVGLPALSQPRGCPPLRPGSDLLRRGCLASCRRCRRSRSRGSLEYVLAMPRAAR
mmetsp:Transcript_42499/g.112028  ORF Transcript_42499/g.112028 Transcript_42499/m.112028 type:complete len:250 (-) Transcript_42499:150-899(-)